jgi:hypothetical protein
MQELVSKNLNAQAAANRQAQMGMDLKAQAEQRALNALIQSGQLGGQMQERDFGQQAQQAQAADLINRFNLQNRQDIQSRNVGSKNQAQQYNVNQRQNISNQNVGLKNQSQQYQNELAQRRYENELKKRGIISGAQTNLAGTYGQESDRNRQFLGDLIGAGAAVATGTPKKP